MRRQEEQAHGLERPAVRLAATLPLAGGFILFADKPGLVAFKLVVLRQLPLLDHVPVEHAGHRAFDEGVGGEVARLGGGHGGAVGQGLQVGSAALCAVLLAVVGNVVAASAAEEFIGVPPGKRHHGVDLHPQVRDQVAVIGAVAVGVLVLLEPVDQVVVTAIGILPAFVRMLDAVGKAAAVCRGRPGVERMGGGQPGVPVGELHRDRGLAHVHGGVGIHHAVDVGLGEGQRRAQGFAEQRFHGIGRIGQCRIEAGASRPFGCASSGSAIEAGARLVWRIPWPRLGHVRHVLERGAQEGGDLRTLGVGEAVEAAPLDDGIV